MQQINFPTDTRSDTFSTAVRLAHELIAAKANPAKIQAALDARLECRPDAERVLMYLVGTLVGYVHELRTVSIGATAHHNKLMQEALIMAASLDERSGLQGGDL